MKLWFYCIDVYSSCLGFTLHLFARHSLIPLVQLLGAGRPGSQYELNVPANVDAMRRGPSPMASSPLAARQAAENSRNASQHSLHAQPLAPAEVPASPPSAPLLASRPHLGPQSTQTKEGYDYMLPLDAQRPMPPLSPKGSDAHREGYEPLADPKLSTLPVLAVTEESDGPGRRPVRTNSRRTGEYAFMPSRSDSNPPPPLQPSRSSAVLSICSVLDIVCACAWLICVTLCVFLVIDSALCLLMRCCRSGLCAGSSSQRK